MTINLATILLIVGAIFIGMRAFGAPPLQRLPHLDWGWLGMLVWIIKVILVGVGV